MQSNKLNIREIGVFCAYLIGIALLVGGSIYVGRRHTSTVMLRPAPASAPTMLVRNFKASIDVARVFGRSPGCAEADPNFIALVADEAISANLDPRLFAAVVAIESGCNQYATSSKGAIGLCQIVPKIWASTYDLEHRYNLLNPQDNLYIGASILGNFVKQYGTTAGLRRYNGVGTDSDPGYTDKIAALAAKR